MPLTFEIWLKQLREAAVEGHFFTVQAAEHLTPNYRASWLAYYQEGYGPQAALEEDLSGDVGV